MTKQKKKAPNNPTFESTIKSLENLVEKLENQETSLEESLRAFESGIALTRSAQKSLFAAEQKVRTLTDSNAGLLEEGINPSKKTG